MSGPSAIANSASSADRSKFYPPRDSPHPFYRESARRGKHERHKAQSSRDRTPLGGHYLRVASTLALMLRRLLPTATLLMLAGCFDATADAGGDGPDDDYMDDQPPPGGCQTSCPDTTSGGSAAGGPCLDTADCADGGVCSAVFDGDVQSFQCQVACIPLMDETQWCADDEACCDGAVCSPRGFCIPPTGSGGLDSSGSDTESASSSTDGGASTGGSTAGSSSGGSSSTG